MQKETQAPFIIPDGELTTAVVRVAFKAFVLSLQSLDDVSLCLAFERVVAVVRHPYVAALQALRTETRSSPADTENALAETEALLAEKEVALTTTASPATINTEVNVAKAVLAESEAPLGRKAALVESEAPSAEKAATSWINAELADKGERSQETRAAGEGNNAFQENQESRAAAEGNSALQESQESRPAEEGSSAGRGNLVRPGWPRPFKKTRGKVNSGRRSSRPESEMESEE